jgi:hypothetical protein
MEIKKIVLACLLLPALMLGQETRKKEKDSITRKPIVLNTVIVN